MYRRADFAIYFVVTLLISIVYVIFRFGCYTDIYYYLSVDFVAGLADMDGVSAFGSLPTNTTDEDIEDEVGGIGIGIGHRWNSYRLELEYIWRYRFDVGALFGTIGIDPNVARFDEDLSTGSLMLNAFWNYQNQSSFTPYVVGSLGWAFHDSETQHLFLNTTENNETSSNNFAWGIGAGITYDINTNWKAHVEYKYTDLGDPKIDVFLNGTTMVPGGYTCSDLSLGIQYSF